MVLEKIARMRVEGLLTEPVILPNTAPFSKIIGIMREKGIYEVFVEETERLGVITTRDVLNARNIATSKVLSLMVYTPELTPADTVGRAARLMSEYRVRSLPVVMNGRVKGQITALSIIEAMKPQDLSGLRAKDIMTHNPISILSEDTALKARNLMLRRRIDHLPVTKDNRLVGVLTSNHIVFAMIPASRMESKSLGEDVQVRLDLAVEGLMDKNTLTCRPEDKMAQVLSGMLEQHSTYSLATFLDEVHGIMTYRDLVKLVAEPSKVGMAPVYIVGLPEDPFEAEAAKDKFSKATDTLKRSFPEIEEARSIIKQSKRGGRVRYEVRAMIKTPWKTIAYSEIGWDLPSIYDRISDRMKRLLAQRPSRRREKVRE